MWICRSALSQLQEKHSAVGNTVCVAQIVDGSQQIDGGAGVSEPENRLKAQKGPPVAEICAFLRHFW